MWIPRNREPADARAESSDFGMPYTTDIFTLRQRSFLFAATAG
jgi:hypothetical protein